jgi:methanogenic corrinoid protein MtbC1
MNLPLHLPDELIDTLTAKKLRNKMKVMIGAATANETFGKESKSDGYGTNAGYAIKLAKRVTANSAWRLVT